MLIHWVTDWNMQKTTCAADFVSVLSRMSFLFCTGAQFCCFLVVVFAARRGLFSTSRFASGSKRLITENGTTMRRRGQEIFVQLIFQFYVYRTHTSSGRMQGLSDYVME